MRFIYSADIHATGYLQDKIIKESNLPERLDSIKNVLHQMSDYARLENINSIIFGGDLLHNKSIIYTDALNLLLDYFRENKDLTYYLIDGNHDLSSKGEYSTSALKSLESEINIVRYKEATKISGDQILLVPYSNNMIKDIKNNSCEYLISHFGLNEGTLNSGVSLVADLGINDLKGKYKFVYLGHYHSPQEIITKEIEIYYVGSPIQRDWGEKGETKRFLVVDTNTKKTLSVPTTGYKEYHELKITQDNKDEVIKQATKLKESGHEIKLVKSEIFDTTDIKDFKLVEKIERDITNRGINSSMSTEEKILKYIQIKNIPEDKIEKYKRVGMEIISRVYGEK